MKEAKEKVQIFSASISLVIVFFLSVTVLLLAQQMLIFATAYMAILIAFAKHYFKVTPKTKSLFITCLSLTAVSIISVSITQTQGLGTKTLGLIAALSALNLLLAVILDSIFFRSVDKITFWALIELGSVDALAIKSEELWNKAFTYQSPKDVPEDLQQEITRIENLRLRGF